MGGCPLPACEDGRLARFDRRAPRLLSADRVPCATAFGRSWERCQTGIEGVVSWERRQGGQVRDRAWASRGPGPARLPRAEAGSAVGSAVTFLPPNYYVSRATSSAGRWCGYGWCAIQQMAAAVCSASANFFPSVGWACDRSFSRSGFACAQSNQVRACLRPPQRDLPRWQLTAAFLLRILPWRYRQLLPMV